MENKLQVTVTRLGTLRKPLMADTTWSETNVKVKCSKYEIIRMWVSGTLVRTSHNPHGKVPYHLQGPACVCHYTSKKTMGRNFNWLDLSICLSVTLSPHKWLCRNSPNLVVMIITWQVLEQYHIWPWPLGPWSGAKRSNTKMCNYGHILKHF